MAVYTEIEDDNTWGIRVTLLGNDAKVEAIDSPKCSHYHATKRLVSIVRPPSFIEKLKGITFKDKLMAEVEAKRLIAQEENEKLVSGKAAEEI
jgi:hypothetical protein